MAVVDSDSWARLMRIRAWTPLSKAEVRATSLSDNVWRVRFSEYVFVVDSDLRGDESQAPYITMVMWAESDGAALRAADANIEADDARLETRPPSILMPESCAPEYGAILSGLRKQGDLLLESAEYRIGLDGAFVQKLIRAKRFSYCFRKPEDDAFEKPFAVLARLA